MHRAALAALALTVVVSLGVGTGGCNRSTGVEVSISLFLECDGARGAPLDIESLRIDIAPCGQGAATCGVTASDQFFTGTVGQVVYVQAPELSPMDPLEVLLENADGMPGMWIRIFATAISSTGTNVATGWLDVLVDQAGLLRPSEPLVLYPAACGYLPDPDYDGDGFVGADDCDGFNPGVNIGAEEHCSNLVDDDCDTDVDLDDGGCFDPDADDDGLCASGIEEAVLTVFGTDVPTSIRADCLDTFTDCDDTSPAIGEICACDLDLDGYCTEAFFCPHSAMWGLSIVCAPGGDCCDAGDPAMGCGAIFPGQIESCDGIDNDCDGKLDVGAEGTASCLAFDDGVLSCAAGVYCPGNVSNGANNCHDLGYAVFDIPEEACTASELGCIDVLSGQGSLAGCASETLTIHASPPLSPGGAGSCTMSVINPHDPLMVTLTSPMMATGTGCAGFDVSVDLSGVTVPGVYSFYVEVETVTTATTTAVYRFDVNVVATCGAMGAVAFNCDAG